MTADESEGVSHGRGIFEGELSRDDTLTSFAAEAKKAAAAAGGAGGKDGKKK